MSPLKTVLAASIATMSLLFLNVPFADSSCNGPMISLDGSSGAPGSMVTVTGIAMMDTCNDIGPAPPPPNVPSKGVRILFIQNGKSQEIGRADANAKFEISVKVTVPATAVAGKAAIAAETTRWHAPSRSFTVEASHEKKP